MILDELCWGRSLKRLSEDKLNVGMGDALGGELDTGVAEYAVGEEEES